MSAEDPISGDQNIIDTDDPDVGVETQGRARATPRVRARGKTPQPDIGADETTELSTEAALDLVPLLITRSGRYLYERRIVLPPIVTPIPSRIPGPGGVEMEDKVYDEDVNAIAFYQREEVQVDVDGRYPQMTISGTRSGLLTVTGHWVASVQKVATNTYQGPIWYKDGSPSAIPHTFIKAVVSGGFFQKKLEITFTGGGAAAFSRSYAFDSGYHRKVEFEYDTVTGATAVTSIQTHAHPNRPASLPSETLSLETVYRRAGFDVSMSGGNSAIPIGGAGANARWSDQEMHDAMQIHWSRFANKPQWSLWVLFASLHEQGTSLGGIMFDDIGPNHRQGTAIFSDAFIATPPAGETSPAAWVKRMRFWTAAHEMGHAFNLAHSWQKAASPTLPGNPWIPLTNDLEARSFMNYPYSVSGGQAAFFANFAYRFTNQELLFLRHAPSRFVEMGNEDWFTNHGFQEAAMLSDQDYEFRLSVSAPGGRFPYLTPPVVEMALINRAAYPKMVSGARLSERSDLTFIINPERGEPRRWLPYLRHCGEGDVAVLQPGEAIYDSLMAGAGRNGWDMAEPGRYCVQAVLTVGEQQVYSNQLVITVEPPATRQEQRLAADLFTPEVGQVLAVNGTRGLDRVNAVLDEVRQLGDNPISKLAAVALATPLTRDFKLLEIGGGSAETTAAAESVLREEQKIETYKADPGQAQKLIEEAVDDDGDAIVNAMGHARFLREAPKLAAVVGGGQAATTEAALASTKSTQKVAKSALPLSGEMTQILDAKAAGLTR